MRELPFLTPTDIVIAALRTREALTRLPNEPGARELLIRYVIEGSDLFLGLLPDGTHRIIKGDNRLALIESGITGSGPLLFNAAHMRSEAEACHFRRFYGDEADPMRSSSPNRVFVLCED